MKYTVDQLQRRTLVRNTEIHGDWKVTEDHLVPSGQNKTAAKERAVCGAFGPFEAPAETDGPHAHNLCERCEYLAARHGYQAHPPRFEPRFVDLECPEGHAFTAEVYWCERRRGGQTTGQWAMRYHVCPHCRGTVTAIE